MPRPSVNGNVRQGQIRPAATPTGLAIPDFAGLARGYQAPGTALADSLRNISPSLNQALGAGVEAHTEQESNAAKVAIQDQAREAKTLDELAGLVSKKLIDETQSGAFYRAYRELAAGELAQRYHVEVAKRIEDEIARQRAVPTDTGVSPALNDPKSAQQIQAEVYASLAKGVPGLLKSVQARAKLGDLIAESNDRTNAEYTKAQKEVMREYVRTSATTGLAMRMQSLAEKMPGGQLTPESMAEFSQVIKTEIHDASIANPGKIVFQAASIAANRIAAAGGVESIRAAQAFAESAAQIKVGNLEAGQDAETAEDWTLLVKRLDAAADAEEQKDAFSSAKQDRIVTDKVRDLLGPHLAELEGPKAAQTVDAIKAQIRDGSTFITSAERVNAEEALNRILAGLGASKTELGVQADEANVKAALKAAAHGDFEAAHLFNSQIGDPRIQESNRQTLLRDQDILNTVEKDPQVVPVLSVFNSFNDKFTKEFDGEVPDSYITGSAAAMETIQGYKREVLGPAFLGQNQPGGKKAFLEALDGLKQVRDEAMAPLQKIAERRRAAESLQAKLLSERKFADGAFDADLRDGIVSPAWATKLEETVRADRNQARERSERFKVDLDNMAVREALSTLGTQSGEVAQALAARKGQEFSEKLQKEHAKEIEAALASPDSYAALISINNTMRDRVRKEVPNLVLGEQSQNEIGSVLKLGQSLPLQDAQDTAAKVRENKITSSGIYNGTAKLQPWEITAALTSGPTPLFKSKEAAQAVAALAAAQHFSGNSPERRISAAGAALADRSRALRSVLENKDLSGTERDKAVVDSAVGFGIHYKEVLAGKLGTAEVEAARLKQEYQSRFGGDMDKLPSVDLGIGGGRQYVPEGIPRRAEKVAYLSAVNSLNGAKAVGEVALTPEAIKGLDWSRTPLFRSFPELVALRDGFQAGNPEAVDAISKLAVKFGFATVEDKDLHKNIGVLSLLQAQANLFGETF